MASEVDEFDKNIENLKRNVKKSFARVYASLKARELKTLRQLDAIRKQCQEDKDYTRNCVQNIRISFDNEPILLSNISNYGNIDLENLNFDSKTFILEDYVSPEEDHMYSYKNIEGLTEGLENQDIDAIEEAALKQITTNENCVCYVNIKPEEVSKQFREVQTNISKVEICKNCPVSVDNNVVECSESTEDEKSESSDGDMKKIDPTDDWLNSIKNQTETEPSQVSDVMEHSTIACL